MRGGEWSPTKRVKRKYEDNSRGTPEMRQRNYTRGKGAVTRLGGEVSHLDWGDVQIDLRYLAKRGGV